MIDYSQDMATPTYIGFYDNYSGTNTMYCGFDQSPIPKEFIDAKRSKPFRDLMQFLLHNEYSKGSHFRRARIEIKDDDLRFFQLRFFYGDYLYLLNLIKTKRDKYTA